MLNRWSSKSWFCVHAAPARCVCILWNKICLFVSLRKAYRWNGDVLNKQMRKCPTLILLGIQNRLIAFIFSFRPSMSVESGKMSYFDNLIRNNFLSLRCNRLFNCLIWILSQLCFYYGLFQILPPIWALQLWNWEIFVSWIFYHPNRI